MPEPTTEDIAFSVALRSRDSAMEARWLGFVAYAAARGCPTADEADEIIKTATQQAAEAWNAAHLGTPDHGRCPMIEILRRLDDLLGNPRRDEQGARPRPAHFRAPVVRAHP